MRELAPYFRSSRGERENSGLLGGWRSLDRTLLCGKFPDKQGKYREFSRFQGPETYFALEKPRLLSVFVKIPYSTDQGISKCYQGIILRDQGIYWR